MRMRAMMYIWPDGDIIWCVNRRFLLMGNAFSHTSELLSARLSSGFSNGLYNSQGYGPSYQQPQQLGLNQPQLVFRTKDQAALNNYVIDPQSPIGCYTPQHVINDELSSSDQCTALARGKIRIANTHQTIDVVYITSPSGKTYIISVHDAATQFRPGHPGLGSQMLAEPPNGNGTQTPDWITHLPIQNFVTPTVHLSPGMPPSYPRF